MRTNIEIDDAVLDAAMKAGPFKTKKDAVEAGLELLARKAARAILRKFLRTGEVTLVVPDLVLYEVLRGFGGEHNYLQAEKLMLSMSVEQTGGQQLAERAALHDRSLRSAGIKIRNSIDVLIAAFCIDRGYVLLHRDRDFEAFEAHRGLRAWKH